MRRGTTRRPVRSPILRNTPAPASSGLPGSTAGTPISALRQRAARRAAPVIRVGPLTYHNRSFAGIGGSVTGGAVALVPGRSLGGAPSGASGGAGSCEAASRQPLEAASARATRGGPPAPAGRLAPYFKCEGRFKLTYQRTEAPPRTRGNPAFSLGGAGASVRRRAYPASDI